MAEEQTQTQQPVVEQKQPVQHLEARHRRVAGFLLESRRRRRRRVVDVVKHEFRPFQPAHADPGQRLRADAHP